MRDSQGGCLTNFSQLRGPFEKMMDSGTSDGCVMALQQHHGQCGRITNSKPASPHTTVSSYLHNSVVTPRHIEVTWGRGHEPSKLHTNLTVLAKFGALGDGD